jgi:hypothetical protein
MAGVEAARPALGRGVGSGPGSESFSTAAFAASRGRLGTSRPEAAVTGSNP